MSIVDICLLNIFLPLFLLGDNSFLKHLYNCSNSTPSTSLEWTIHIYLPWLTNQTITGVLLDKGTLHLLGPLARTL